MDCNFCVSDKHLRGHQLYNKKNAGAKFLPWKFKNLANTRQVGQGAVELCQKVMTGK